MSLPVRDGNNALVAVEAEEIEDGVFRVAHSVPALEAATGDPSDAAWDGVASDPTMMALLKCIALRLIDDDARVTLLNGTNGAQTSPSSGALPGGRYLVSLAGTFAGAGVQLQALMADGATWANFGEGFFDVGSAVIEVGAGQAFRAVVTGGAPVGIFVKLGRIG